MSLFIKNKYNSFNKCLNVEFCKVPLNGSSFVPQGLCFIDNNAVIACYDNKHESNSVLFICDGDSYRTIYLDGRFHCGGICYHSDTDSLYVTGKGINDKAFINRYCGKKIMKAKDLSTVYVENVFCVDSDNSLYSTSAKHSSASFITCFKNDFYVGNYVGYKYFNSYKAIIKKYKILNDGNLSSKYSTLNNPFSNTQGVCIYKDSNVEYFAFSRSFGRNRNSLINIARLIDNKFVCINSVVLPSMLEQVCTYRDKIGVLFESCAKCYKLCINRSDFVGLLNFQKLLSKDDSFKDFNKGTSILCNNYDIDIKGK